MSNQKGNKKTQLGLRINTIFIKSMIINKDIKKIVQFAKKKKGT